ncbi:uncharacterized protein PRCAT00000739001 [Priceomyces carsonii]|uniref:uncharacterized protein n=1 Tax=Priceomyces carsonii TaxID=28549 RepID=UPI002EDA88E4|nr:unnamed protein product [Priceomyces carsonii]
MSGSIVRVLDWNVGLEQQFLAVNPIGDEVILYETQHDDPNIESNDLIKLNCRGGFDNIQCSSYSPNNKGITGVGGMNGTVSIFDINSDTSSILKLRPKQNRPCNSISFNNKNLVAAGFDKGRQDSSLQIWNIEHYSRNSNNDHIKRPLHSYLTNEAVLSTTFYPERDNSLLCGSYKFLREIDLRLEVPVFQMATKYTLGVTNDPFQSHLFSSFTEDGSFAVWDRRKLTSNSSKYKSLSNSNVITETPILQFNKLLSDPSSRKHITPCIRYSTIRKGEFSSVFNGNLIRRWNTGSVSVSTPAANDAKNKTTRSSNILQSLKNQSSQLYKQSEESLFVALVLDVKTDYERVVSFDYSPDLLSNSSTNFVCMRQSGSVFRMPVVESIESLDFNSYNEFTFAGPEGTMTQFTNQDDFSNDDLSVRGNGISKDTIATLNDTQISEEIATTIDDDESSTAVYHNAADSIKYNEDDDFIPLDNFLDLGDIINNDIGSVIRRRAELGYSVDCEKNIALLDTMSGIENQQGLINTWKWILLAKKSLEKGTMITQSIDLGYQGVLGIWKGLEEIGNQNRITKETSITDSVFSQAVKSIVSSKGKRTNGITISSNSDRKAQRKLALIVSGWLFNDDEFESKLKILISMGYYEKAAGWAVFYGDVPKAIDILANSNKERLRLISTAVAGYLAYNNTTANSPWKDQCRRMASELSDPYLRAIFAFIADNDWWDVLDEHSLPLKERLGVALRFLSDKDLTIYLNRLVDTVVHNGELDGLILTGLTPRGMDLLQCYVDRTSDVQTASLIGAFGCPRYFHDQRVNHWVDCYRRLLNSWGMFSVRAKFDVARVKLSKNGSGHLTLKAIPKQVYLQCIRCNKNLSKPKSASNPKGNSTNPTIMMKQFNKLTTNSRDLDIKACPHCGAAFPRCSICLLSMGTPVPNDSSSNLQELDLSDRIENSFREWFSFCLSCNHGSHAIHAEEWFSKHYVCPVPDCNCRCNSR